MQAVLRHAGVGVARAQELVAPGRAVAANHIDFAAGIGERRGQVVEKVEEPRIEMTHISGAVVAQIMVELVHRFGNVFITAAIDDIQPLARVSVKEAEPVLARGRGPRLCAAVSEERRQQKQENPNVLPHYTHPYLDAAAGLKGATRYRDKRRPTL